MFIPGKPELVLGTVEWLNRSNKFEFLPYVFLAAGLLFIVIGYFLVGRERRKKVILVFLSVLPGFVIGLVFFTHFTEKTYPAPVNHTPYKKVYFEDEHSDILLPTRKLVDKHKKSIHTFYVWTQRLGYVPLLETKYMNCLQKELKKDLM